MGCSSRHSRGLGAEVVGIERLAAVITAHRMRAFLFASATTALCHPERSRKPSTHLDILSLRPWAVITADFAPWITRRLLCGRQVR